jgi:ATP:corrinoid adenosyltransferase
MKKSRIPAVLLMLVTFSPFAHASIEEGAHQFKEDAKSAGHKTGAAIGDAARAVGHGAKNAGVAVGHGAKQAGHAVADASKKGWHATKNFVTGKD